MYEPIYEICSKSDIFKKYIYINKTDLPCVWCCVCFGLCAFGAILKRFRRLLIFHVHSLLVESEHKKSDLEHTLS